MNMKKLMMVAMLMVITVTAKALSYDVARSEALFLSDKMAYELNLSPSQYEAIYEINLDYFMLVTTKYDLYSDLWKHRNFEIQRVLTPLQYENFMRVKYFYRPLGWRDDRWEFRVYRVYPNRSHFMLNRPKAYTNYRGGGHFRTGPAQVAPPRPAPRPNQNVRPQNQRPPQTQPPQQGQHQPQGQRQPQTQRPPQQGQRQSQGQRPQQDQRQPQGQRPQRVQRH